MNSLRRVRVCFSDGVVRQISGTGLLELLSSATAIMLSKLTACLVTYFISFILFYFTTDKNAQSAEAVFHWGRESLYMNHVNIHKMIYIKTNNSTLQHYIKQARMKNNHHNFVTQIYMKFYTNATKIDYE